MIINKLVEKNMLLMISFIAMAVACIIFRGKVPYLIKDVMVRPGSVIIEAEGPALAAAKEEIPMPGGWREEFNYSAQASASGLPSGWVVQSKPGTALAKFSVKHDGNTGHSFLRAESEKASGSIIIALDGVDLEKTPYLRWRWRVEVLPEGADGRIRSKDDQAIGIYIGSGSALSNKSVSYRWDTDTPKGAEGNVSYGLGVIKVRWHTLRNKEDSSVGQWVVEERNVAEDFKEAWGYYPDDVYLSISCNSQYTGSSAVAYLDWIGLDSQPMSSISELSSQAN